MLVVRLTIEAILADLDYIDDDNAVLAEDMRQQGDIAVGFASVSFFYDIRQGSMAHRITEIRVCARRVKLC